MVRREGTRAPLTVHELRVRVRARARVRVRVWVRVRVRLRLRLRLRLRVRVRYAARSFFSRSACSASSALRPFCRVSISCCCRPQRAFSAL